MKKSKMIIIAAVSAVVMGAACFAIAIFGDTSNFDYDKTYFCPGVCIRENAAE